MFGTYLLLVIIGFLKRKEKVMNGWMDQPVNEILSECMSINNQAFNFFGRITCGGRNGMKFCEIESDEPKFDADLKFLESNHN